jgi:hypothetical protein
MVQTVQPQDVQGLLESSVLDPTLIMLDGAPRVVSASDLATDRYRGAMVVTTRQDLLDQFEGSRISDGDVERLTTKLNVEINPLRPVTAATSRPGAKRPPEHRRVSEPDAPE